MERARMGGGLAERGRFGASMTWPVQPRAYAACGEASASPPW